MSLINKMLQDLEQRNDSAKNEPLAGEVRAVPGASATRPGLLAGLLVLGIVIIAAVWMVMKPKASSPVAAVSPPAPVVAMASVAAPVVPASAPAPVPVVVPAPEVVAAATVAAVPSAASSEKTATKRQRVAETKMKPRAVALVAQAEPATAQAVVKKPSKVVSEETAPTPPPAPKPPPQSQMQKHFSPQQQSDNLYKQAVTQMQQGKSNEAKQSLRQSLEANPGNIKARQVLVDMLVEGSYFEEATALLHEGLKLAPEQSGFSMALARLQLDRGNTAAALVTLEQGLQAAGDEPQYNAFYAVLLQRAQRHEEAVRHYLVALRSDPMMPTWLVGIGISLQAQGKNVDAAEAFGRARDSGQLTPQLGQFVEQRLSQLK